MSYSAGFKIGNTPIKNPSNFKMSFYNITKAARTANGSMSMELVAKKRKFFFEYEIISAAQKKEILDLIDTEAMFFTLTYVEDNVTKTATVYVGEIPMEKHRQGLGSNGQWYWKGFNFNLIEK